MNDDKNALPVVWHDTRAMEWEASPSPSVWRKRLELNGPPEAGRVTSVVRYDANSQFNEHPHPDGEEILVLSGVFSDEHGDYPAGSYLLNPEGFSHAPRSQAGCELFVKLRQYAGTDRASVRVDTNSDLWQDTEGAGIKTMHLYSDDVYDDRMQLLRFDIDSSLTLSNSAGVELFVLDGQADCNELSLAEGSWVRYNPGQTVQLRSSVGVTLYVKTNHLPSA